MRTIIEEKSVENYINKNCKPGSFENELYESLKWRLSREPEVGLKINNIKENHWILKLSPSPQHIPNILVIYKFDDKNVYLVEVLIYPK